MPQTRATDDDFRDAVRQFLAAELTDELRQAGRRASGIFADAADGNCFLLFGLDLPGITLRPIISISGDHELNLVFFDDLRAPASALLGQESRGWTIANDLLMHERGGSYAPLLRARLARFGL